ncbi:hypothetical protein NC797_12090 [Aquibacillus sp. 3ASR75-11]|uniref:Uncharacterized protein n=1 Tax=Terrihalobacillus insolitus TaxID=2950438 RepID=A0A9X4AMX0_9BACI|nr:hypothetical protein [Terrihalobacillus insolitus]MDC3413465.1 hypothetical protein [Terrihalobacillus insolitus]MDC3425244.1 hypothetical protein [Terrihalobacillus insolitus]
MANYGLFSCYYPFLISYKVLKDVRICRLFEHALLEDVPKVLNGKLRIRQ